MAIGDDNIILSANDAALELGVVVGQPGYLNRADSNISDHLTTLRPDYAKYRARNEVVAYILRKYDARAESVGLDEFNIDVTDYAAQSTI